MSLTSVIQNLTKKTGDVEKTRRNARKQLKAYAIELSQGKQPDYTKIEKLLEEANADAQAFSKFLDNLDQRIKAKKKYESFDYEAEMSQWKEDRANTGKELETAQQLLADTQKKVQELHEKGRRLLSKSDQLRDKATKNNEVWERTLAMTGGGEDWDDIEFHP